MTHGGIHLHRMLTGDVSATFGRNCNAIVVPIFDRRCSVTC